MKRKVKIIDKTTGKTIEKEVNFRNIDHFNAQLKNRAVIFADKRKKDPKYKHKIIDDE